MNHEQVYNGIKITKHIYGDMIDGRIGKGRPRNKIFRKEKVEIFELYAYLKNLLVHMKLKC